MPAQATVVRRLWYESHVLFVGSMRQKLERSSDAPKRMPHAEREERANVLTRNTATIALAAYDANVPFVIEKPPASHLWAMSCMQDVAELPGAFSAIFQACRYGGRRDKRTKLLATWGPVKNFCKMCDKSHTHLPWGVLLGARSTFATAEECEYPAGMCKEVDRLLRRPNARGRLRGALSLSVPIVYG